jgi:hypothetical protein
LIAAAADANSKREIMVWTWLPLRTALEFALLRILAEALCP